MTDSTTTTTAAVADATTALVAVPELAAGVADAASAADLEEHHRQQAAGQSAAKLAVPMATEPQSTSILGGVGSTAGAQQPQHQQRTTDAIAASSVVSQQALRVAETAPAAGAEHEPQKDLLVCAIDAPLMCAANVSSLTIGVESSFWMSLSAFILGDVGAAVKSGPKQQQHLPRTTIGSIRSHFWGLSSRPWQVPPADWSLFPPTPTLVDAGSALGVQQPQQQRDVMQVAIVCCLAVLIVFVVALLVLGSRIFHKVRSGLLCTLV